MDPSGTPDAPIIASMFVSDLLTGLSAYRRQRRAERALARRGIRFRDTDPAVVAAAYSAMTDHEFDAINAMQDWANWRTIPRALRGHVPDRPLAVLDLGCGTGSSTAALAYHCPPGSSIIGYELAELLVACARRRSYVQRNGTPARVEFVCQSVTEPLQRPDGSPVPDGSVDVINSSGIVGHHLDAVLLAPLIKELQRVLAPAGIAMLDVGPSLPARTLVPLMASAGFSMRAHRRSWLLDPTGQVVFRRSMPG